MILRGAGARRPSDFDGLGPRRKLSDRALPLLLAAMAFLAALALAGWFASATLGRQWREGAGVALTVQVPRPADPQPQGDGTRLGAVLALLAATPGVASARALSERELADLLEPSLGRETEPPATATSAVIAIRLAKVTESQEALSRRLSGTAPGTLLQDHGSRARRLRVLARGLQACAGGAVLLVGAVAAVMVALAIRAGLSARRQAIEIVHGLGATDSYIARRFTGRATRLAAAGAGLGTLAALPALLALAQLAAPFGDRQAVAGGTPSHALQDALASLPLALWYALPCLPLGAAAIGLAMAQAAVRHWLRRLP